MGRALNSLAELAAKRLLERARCHLPTGVMQLPPRPYALRNNLIGEKTLREVRRGGMLDKNRGETGLQQRIIEGQQVDVLQLSSDNRANPVIVTVGIDVNEVSPAAVNGPADVRLQTILSWGTGKGVSRATVDTRVGGQITLSASILNVAVSYPPPLVTVGGPAPVFLVSGIVAYGNRPGAGNPALTFTDALVSLADNAFSGLFRIPKYAVAVAWVSDASPIGATPPDAILRFFGQNAGTASVVAQANPAANVFIPVPNGAYFIDIQNISGAAFNQGYRLIYELVL